MSLYAEQKTRADGNSPRMIDFSCHCENHLNLTFRATAAQLTVRCQNILNFVIMIKLSIQGPQAVGKTKVIKAIESRFRGMTFSYENPFPIVNKRHQLGLDISIEADFSENQRLFY